MPTFDINYQLQHIISIAESQSSKNPDRKQFFF